MPSRIRALVLLFVVLVVTVTGLQTAAVAATNSVGTVLSSKPLPKSLWIPGTRAAWKLTYVSTDVHGKRVTVGGTVFIPKGTAPKGGWPSSK